MFYHQLCFLQCMWPETSEHGSVMCLAQLQGELLFAFETPCVEVAIGLGRDWFPSLIQDKTAFFHKGCCCCAAQSHVSCFEHLEST